MKKLYLTLAAVPLLALTGCKCLQALPCGKGATQKKAAMADASGADAKAAEEAAMMAAWQEYMTPTSEHERLAAQSGTWHVKSRVWEAPGAEPMESTATAEIAMVMGGRYQEETWNGSMMGMPFEGRSLVGYNNATGEFTSVWIDSMGTGTAVAKGKRRADGVIELRGEMNDPMGDTMQTRIVVAEEADGSPNMEMWITHPKYGPEYKMMELDYDRAPAGTK